MGFYMRENGGDFVRKIRIKINYQNRIYSVESLKGKLLKDVLEAEGIAYSFPCGGDGRCGKCKVRFTEGAPKASTSDVTFFSAKELAQGYRLLCRCVLDGDCAVEIGDTSEERIAAESVSLEPSGARLAGGAARAAHAEGRGSSACDRFGIAVDIGTTTIAAALVGIDADGGSKIIATASGINHQRQYGADVISRIAYASEGDGLQKLHDIVISDVEKLVENLRSRSGAEVSGLVVTGNTTMLHIFRNISVESLGRFPYKTERLELETCNMYGIETVIMPGFTAYVGADILSGIYYTDLMADKKSLLLDLGTNGEMAYYNGRDLRICSTAAGPVFEGGTISCGIASIPGAISHIRIARDGGVSYETIGGEEPKGLCGTGVMEAVSELVRCGIVSKEGLLSEEFFDKGFPITEAGNIRITQEDVRNIQLAKAAIRSGIEQLIGMDIPDRVFISGGFGTNIDYDAIRALKIFPAGIDGNCVGAGNTALKGAVKYLTAKLLGEDKAENALLNKIKMSATELILANKDDFDDTFVEALNF